MRGDNPKIQQCAGKRVPVHGAMHLSKQAALNCAFGIIPPPSSKVVQTWPGCDLLLGPWKTEQTCLRGKEVTRGLNKVKSEVSEMSQS